VSVIPSEAPAGARYLYSGVPRAGNEYTLWCHPSGQQDQDQGDQGHTNFDSIADK
jgi:hypothetical protein